MVHVAGSSAGCAPVFSPEILSVALKFRCTRCVDVLCVEVRWEGHEIRCPKCNMRLKVPRWSQPLGPAETATETPKTGVARLSPEEIEFLSGAKSAVA